MNTTKLTQLSNQIKITVKALEKELAEVYSIENLNLQMDSRYNEYKLTATDCVNGFVMAYGSKLDEVLEDFRGRLTNKTAIRQAKIDRACKLLAEADT